VPVPEEWRGPLTEHTRHMLPATLLWPGADDRNLNRRVLTPACEAAGVPTITVHELRHHAASVWVAGGVPLFEVARALGQADTRMVERTYGHLVPGAHDRLLAARKAARA
jgi:integrase